MNAISKVLHLICIVFLTFISQIGGLIYLLAILLIRKNQSNASWKRFALFIVLYICANQMLVPLAAPLFGRVPIQETPYLTAAMPLTRWLNRNYVKPALNEVLQEVAVSLNQQHKGIQLIYLDACFPFLDGFPLLPHLSHNDGEKADLALLYENNQHHLLNKKPTRSGYGVFEEPVAGEMNTAAFCHAQGFWQYDFPKYLTLGGTAEELHFSEKGNSFLIKALLNQSAVKKLFIEPHLKTRLKLNDAKVRFHGCAAVRHDDHIHVQL